MIATGTNKFNNNLSNCIIITIINIFFISLFLYYSPFDIECDGALFFKTGKFFYDFLFSDNYSVVLSYRPPAFPLYLLLTGTFFFDSLYPFVITNVLLTLISPLLIYFSLNYYGKIKALIFTLFFLFSTILYINLKSSLEIHLITFFIILNISSLINFYNKKKLIFLYLTIFSALLATFTRFDVIFVLFFNLLFLIYFLLKDKSLFKHIAICYSFVGITFALWMVIKFLVLYFYFYIPSGNPNLRDYAKNNKVSLFISSVTSLNHQTGAQLFWRVNSQIRETLNSNKNNNYVYNFLDKNNGPNSKRLHQELKSIFDTESFWEYIYLLRDLMPPVSLNDKKNHYEVFYDHYWRYRNDPNNLVEKIFSKNIETHYYPIQLPLIIANSAGYIEADNLFFNVSKEIIFNNENIQKKLISSILYLYPNKDMNLVSYQWYNIKSQISHNDCVQISLSKNMYTQYVNSYNKNSFINNYISSIIKKTVINLKNSYRFLTFILLVSLIFIFPFSKQKILVTVIFFQFIFVVLPVGIFGGIINDKYENYINVFLYYILFLLSLPIVNYIDNRLFKIKNS